MAVTQNEVRLLSSNTGSSKEIKQCIQNSEGKKSNYTVKLKSINPGWK